MGDEQYFAQALTNFTRNFGYGDAICHLVDRGYTTEKILREFQYPLPKDTIDRMVTDHLIDNVEKHFENVLDDFAYLKQIQDDRLEFWLRQDQDTNYPSCSRLRSLNGKKLIRVMVQIDRKKAESLIDQVGSYLSFLTFVKFK